MFAKRVKLIRDINREIDILDRKCTREISKLNDDIEHQVRKRFKKAHPASHVEVQKIDLDDFLFQKKHSNAFRVEIYSLNNLYIHEGGFWVEYSDSFGYKKTENIISCEEFLEIVDELSETLGILLFVEKIIGPYLC